MLFCCFFVSCRRRHTRCALVTGVQTCALPISRDRRTDRREPEGPLVPRTARTDAVRERSRYAAALARPETCMRPSLLFAVLGLVVLVPGIAAAQQAETSEASRVGKERVTMCRYRLSPYP